MKSVECSVGRVVVARKDDFCGGRASSVVVCSEEVKVVMTGAAGGVE